MFSRISSILEKILAVLGKPVRTARGRGGIVVQPYRGYGSREQIFLIGRVFRQSTENRARTAFGRKLRDVMRRIMRRSVAGARIRAAFHGAVRTVETDRDGYFRFELFPKDPVPKDREWHEVALFLESPERVEVRAEVFIPPERARLVVVSDIDDTVMYTGVADRLGMLWRLFAQDARSRTAFPGVSALYRALHAGASGNELNPMLYVSRAPWGLYEVLDTFFQHHRIPVGPILFLREWGISWTRPFPRRAEDHKRALIEAMMRLYRDVPFVLIGDSGQHDPEIYADIVREFGGRVIAVYIRNVAPADARREEEIAAIAKSVIDAGSHLVLATDSVAMAEHAAKLGLIAPAAVEAVRRRLTPEEQADAAGKDTLRIDDDDGSAAAMSDVADAAESEAEGETRKVEVAGTNRGTR